MADDPEASPLHGHRIDEFPAERLRRIIQNIELTTDTAQRLHDQICNFGRVLISGDRHDEEPLSRMQSVSTELNFRIGGLVEEITGRKPRKFRIGEIDERRFGEVCAVCLDDLYKDSEGIVALDCRHDYHVNCIERWITRMNSCPLCRSVISIHGQVLPDLMQQSINNWELLDGF